MNIYTNSVCVEDNGDFFYTQELHKGQEIVCSLELYHRANLYHFIRGTRIGFDLVLPEMFEVKDVVLWRFVLTQHKDY